MPVVCLWLLLCASARATAQAAPVNDPFLDHLAGTWVLRGTIGGKPTTHDVTAEWVLNHLYLRLHEVSREKDAAGHPQYEAIVTIGWDGTAREYQCLWLDSTAGGGLTPQSMGRGTREGDKVPFLWREKDGTLSFTNTFVYDKAGDAWIWIMDNIHQGKPVPFARLTLARQEPDGQPHR